VSIQTRQKQERIIEAVRRGLEGDHALTFIRQSGFSITPVGFTRHLKALGGRNRIQELIQQGMSNVEILEILFPAERLARLRAVSPVQSELFGAQDLSFEPISVPGLGPDEFDSTRLTIRVPNELYHALTIAARVERTNRNQLIVDVLTAALSKMPGPDRFPELDLPFDEE
jgi:hypothetical protein